MEQGRQRMLQKWAEPAWGARQNLLEEMAAAARANPVATTQQPVNGTGSGGQGQAGPGQALQYQPQMPSHGGLWTQIVKLPQILVTAV